MDLPSSQEGMIGSSSSGSQESSLKSQSQQREKLEKLSSVILVFSLHNFFSIFLVSEVDITRPQLLSLYFMRINMLISISGLFSEQQDQIRSILLSIVSAVLLSVPVIIVEKFFRSKSRIANFLGAFIFICVTLVSLYVSLTVSALLGIEEANKWAISYMISFFMEFALINPLICFVKVSLFLKANTSKGCIYNLVNSLIGKKILEIVEKIKI